MSKQKNHNHFTAAQKRSFIRASWQFIKLNLAGNILFWGTLVGSFVLHDVIGWNEIVALATASILAHIGFFIVDKKWVFADKKSSVRKTRDQFARFAVFMGINYFINIGLIALVMQVTPLNLYISQIVSSFFFIFWNFIGLRWWVFREAKKSSRNSLSQGAIKRRKQRVTQAS